jgi:hypothetical protein
VSPDAVEKYTATLRDMAGLAGFMHGEGRDAFDEFDEWYAAVTKGER